MKKLKKAIAFSIKAHENQKRKNSEMPYFIHPLSVYLILRLVTKDENVLIAGLLHDVIEDTKYSYKDIKKEFGKKIADIVLEVTKNEKKQFNIKTQEGLMIKLADMLHNISDSTNKKYIAKKLKYVNALNGKKKTKKEIREEVLEKLSDDYYFY